MKTIQEQETEAILAMAETINTLQQSLDDANRRLKEYEDRHLQTSSKIVEFARNNPPSYKVKVAEAPKHIGYES
jgi:hypothetical protein